MAARGSQRFSVPQFRVQDAQATPGPSQDAQRRIKTLEQTGVISGYKAAIDPSHLGESLIVFVLVSLERHSKDGVRAFEAAVSRLSMIKEIYHVAGEYDFILKVAVADIKDYQNFNYDELANIPGMGKTSSLIALADRKGDAGRGR